MTSSLNKKELGCRLDKLTSCIVRNREKKCFTCGKRLLFKDRQAGHYVPRVVLKTRWQLENVHVQCAKCNVGLGGNLGVYAEKLDPSIRLYLDDILKKYNRGVAPTLSEVEMINLYNLYLLSLTVLRKDNVKISNPKILEWQIIET